MREPIGLVTGGWWGGYHTLTGDGQRVCQTRWRMKWDRENTTLHPTEGCHEAKWMLHKSDRPTEEPTTWRHERTGEEVTTPCDDHPQVRTREGHRYDCNREGRLEVKEENHQERRGNRPPGWKGHDQGRPCTHGREKKPDMTKIFHPTENDRSRQTVCGLRAHGAIWQLRIARPFHPIDEAEALKPICADMISRLARANKTTNFLIDCTARGTKHCTRRRVEQQLKTCASSTDSTSRPHSTHGATALDEEHRLSVSSSSVGMGTGTDEGWAARARRTQSGTAARLRHATCSHERRTNLS